MRLQLVSLQTSSSALLSAPPRFRTVSLVLAAMPKLQTMPHLMLVATLPMVATIPVGPTLRAGVPLPVLLLAVPPTVHTLPVGPTESLVLVPVHLIAVVVCAPVLVLEIAVAAVAAAAPAAMAAAAVADGIVGAASPSCMDSGVSVRGLTRTRQRVVPRCCMGARSNPHPPTGYTSLVDGCEA